MCPDNQVDLSFTKPCQDLFLLLWRSKPAQTLNNNRISFEPLVERHNVLFQQDSCRNKHCHLFIVAYGLERSSHGHFGFSVSHVSAYKTVHGGLPFHISEYFVYTAGLVRGLLVFKGHFKLLEIGIVRGKGESLLDLSPCIQLQEILCGLFNRFFYFFLDPLPGFAAETIQTGDNTLNSPVFLKIMEPVNRQIEPVIPLVFNKDKVIYIVIEFQFYQSVIPSYAMLDMDCEIAFFEILKCNKTCLQTRGLGF